MFAPKYDSTKLKLNIKLANVRLANLQKKMENQGILARKDIAMHLDKGKVELARIKVEQVIRDDYLIEAYELLEMYCSLINTRFGLIDSVKYCDEGIREAVCTVIWAAPRVQADVAEFKAMAQIFAIRYGKEFVEEAMTTHEHVNERVMHKLNVHTPERRIVDGYLANIAKTYKVSWQPPVPDLDVGVGSGSAMASFPMAPTAAPVQYPPPPPAAPGGAYPPAGYAPPQPPQTGFAYPPPAQALYPPAPPFYPPMQPAQHVPQHPPTYSTDPFPSYGGAPDSQKDLMSFPTPPPATLSFPSVPDSPGAGQSATAPTAPPDFDELTRRFQNLRK